MPDFRQKSLVVGRNCIAYLKAPYATVESSKRIVESKRFWSIYKNKCRRNVLNQERSGRHHITKHQRDTKLGRILTAFYMEIDSSQAIEMIFETMCRNGCLESLIENRL